DSAAGARRERDSLRAGSRGLSGTRDPARDRPPGRRAVHRPVVAAAPPVPAPLAGRSGARRDARGLSSAGRRRVALTRPRVVFMGTPDFAVPSLEAVASACDIVAVVTQPDRPRGRGRTASASPVGSTAERLGRDVLKPERPNAP